MKENPLPSNPNTPLLMRFAHIERAYPFQAPTFAYDAETQTTDDLGYSCGESSGCTKATYSTPKVGKDPEGDYAADD